jgi:glycosyltransferase involved in cell wall biosynthesis
MKNVAVVGIQGVPAQYGGFESLVENLIGDHKSEDIRYTVFCSGRDMKSRLAEYRGAELKYVPLRANGVQSIPYDMISFLRIPRKTDVILVLGVSGCLILPVFRLFCRKRLIINIDGLEHRRAKWGKLAKTFLKLSEKMAVRYADVIISDNKGIQDYVREEYGKESELIAYGGDHAVRSVPQARTLDILRRYGLRPGTYAVTVCRIEPENNCHLVLEAFSKSDRELAFVGNWSRSAYGQELKEKYSAFPNIHILDPIYDIDTLYVLRLNAWAYVHGHSAGGTNPSLVEAMFFGNPIFAYDVVYNRETTGGGALYWSSSDELLNLLSLNDFDTSSIIDLANQKYTWKRIANQYEKLY